MVRRRIPIDVDPMFKSKLDRMKRKASDEQEKDISIREITKRMSKTFAMDAMEKEIITDAKAKRRLGIK